MCRFFTIELWQLVAKMGYKFILRMDEDSFLWSPVRYNFFTHLKSRGLDHSWRFWQHGSIAIWRQQTGHNHKRIPFFIRDYVKSRNLATYYFVTYVGPKYRYPGGSAELRLFFS